MQRALQKQYGQIIQGKNTFSYRYSDLAFSKFFKTSVDFRAHPETDRLTGKFFIQIIYKIQDFFTSCLGF